MSDYLSMMDYLCVEFCINDEVARYHDLRSFADVQNCDDDHLVVYYLKEDHMPHNEIERLCRKNEWNHARIYISASVQQEGLLIKESGMYVIKPLCEMEHISFANTFERLLDSSTAGQEQLGARMKEKEVPLDKKRMLMGDDNLDTSSSTFRCTKRGRNISITPQIPFANASDIISNQEATLMDLDLNTALLPMLPWTEHASDTFINQGHSIEADMWLSLRPCSETPFYDESTSNQAARKCNFHHHC